MFFSFIFLLEREVNIGKLLLQHFVFMVQGLTDLVEFFILFSILIDLFFLRKALLSELSDLHLIVAIVKKLSFILLYLNS